MRTLHYNKFKMFWTALISNRQSLSCPAVSGSEKHHFCHPRKSISTPRLQKAGIATEGSIVYNNNGFFVTLRMTNVVNSSVKRYLIFVIIIILLSGCELFKTQNPSEPNNPPRITTKIPTEYTLNKKIGDSIDFEITAIDADDDTIYYKTLVDDVKVNDLNTYTFNIPDIGVYKVQIVAYNAESDTASWTVNVGNTDPVVSGLYNVNGKEDQIVIGSIVRTANISDHEDSLEDLVIELSQTNPDLIKVALDDDNNIIVESYTADGNGSSEITLKVTDTNGGITEKSFAYNITPMTDIEGEILDSDT